MTGKRIRAMTGKRIRAMTGERIRAMTGERIRAMTGKRIRGMTCKRTTARRHAVRRIQRSASAAHNTNKLSTASAARIAA
jgi:uncharacterized protein YbjQ (UPF0145 family)